MSKLANSRDIKVALVHDWLNTKIGGAERTIIELLKIFPEAPVFTLLYDKENFQGLIDSARVRVSNLQNLPGFLHKRSRYMLPLIPKAIESFDFSEFDLVISNSSAFVKNIITKPSTKHICYCNSPMRFAWDYWPKYLDEQKIGLLRSHFVSKQVSKLRLWDYYGSARVDEWIANSANVANRIRKYYHKHAEIIYPPVKTKLFNSKKTPKQNYYVTMSAHAPYKKLDLAVETFNQRGDRLIILGDGPERSTLERQAKSNIIFKGYLSETERATILAGAQALIFPAEEDFGIAMVEALAAATPVIAYNKGGAKEIVKHKKTGILFNTQTTISLNRAIDALNSLVINADELRAEAMKYDQDVFRKNILLFVNKVANKHVSSS